MPPLLRCSPACLLGLVAITRTSAFSNFPGAKQRRQRTNLLRATALPRSGFAQQLLDAALASPVWKYVLVPQARASIDLDLSAEEAAPVRTEASRRRREARS